MAAPGSAQLDSDELARFREQWRAEVKQRKAPNRLSQPDAPASESNTSDKAAPAASDEAAKSPSSPTRPLSNSAARPHHTAVSTHASKGLAAAVEVYRSAILHEESGDLDEALRLYRNAFRTDPNVDKAYRKAELRLEAAALAESSRIKQGHQHVILHGIRSGEVKGTDQIVEILPIQPKLLSAGSLSDLISGFPHDVEFQPEIENEGVPLRQLPDEILVLILKTLDPLSIERFARLNRKARILSLDPTIWRFLVQKTYIPPQISNEVTTDTIAEQYMSDYRRFFIEHPRLRLDGVYIAVCHYVRSGINSDNAWVRVTHLITYHRYLRFFHDGTVLSLLANEDVEPQAIIPLLKPSLRMKGLFVGNWSLEGTTISIRDLTDPGGGPSRYTFQMTLTLRSRPLGRWNKLDFSGYDSVNTASGEAIPLALKHERPFWFSKVRSYAA